MEQANIMTFQIGISALYNKFNVGMILPHSAPQLPFSWQTSPNPTHTQRLQPKPSSTTRCSSHNWCKLNTNMHRTYKNWLTNFIAGKFAQTIRGNISRSLRNSAPQETILSLMFNQLLTITSNSTHKVSTYADDLTTIIIYVFTPSPQIGELATTTVPLSVSCWGY